MPTYKFSCDDGHVQFHNCSMLSRPDVLPCPCGKEAQQVITGGLMGIVKGGTPIEYSKQYSIPNMGRFVRSDEQQHARYQDIVGTARNRANAHRTSASKKSDMQWEHVGCTPLEIHEYVSESTGDKQAFQKDPEYWLKKTDTWIGE
jgi:putative FmdB family regulatory protein